MKKSLKSLNELVNCCRTNNFTSSFPCSLVAGKGAKWKFVSGFADGDVCHAVFISCPSGEEVTLRAIWKSDIQGERGHIETLSVA